jgi:hypothetical protein
VLAKDFTGGREVDPESDTFEMTDDGKFRSQAKDWSYQDIKNQVNYFFEVAQDVATKHFEKEWTGPLLHFAVAGEKDTSVPFCNWLVNNETMGLEMIHSDCHDTTIDLSKMLSTYFAKKMSVEKVKEQGALILFGDPSRRLLRGQIFGNPKKRPTCESLLKAKSCLSLHQLTGWKQWLENACIVQPPTVERLQEAITSSNGWC